MVCKSIIPYFFIEGEICGESLFYIWPVVFYLLVLRCDLKKTLLNY